MRGQTIDCLWSLLTAWQRLAEASSFFTGAGVIRSGTLADAKEIQAVCPKEKGAARFGMRQVKGRDNNTPPVQWLNVPFDAVEYDYIELRQSILGKSANAKGSDRIISQN